MSKPKLTGWFPPSVVPVRDGVYETRWVPESRRPKFPQYQHWNGAFWGGWADHIDTAMWNADDASSRQEPQWRGLAEKPE
jgi:hypothetical protein